MQEVQRGKQLAERAQSTSKLLREDAKGPRRASQLDRSEADAGEHPSGVAGLTKRLEDYAAAFDQISTATGTLQALWFQQLVPGNACIRWQLHVCIVMMRQTAVSSTKIMIHS